MKRLPLLPMIFATSLTCVVLIGSDGSPAAAQTVPARITNALAYPTSSQRFFEAGNEQLEIEIQRLQHNPQAMPTLHISREVQQQQQTLQQQEPRWEELIHKPRGNQESLLPTGEFR